MTRESPDRRLPLPRLTRPSDRDSPSRRRLRVELGSELHVELTGATPGSEISFDRILLVRTDSTTEIGTPVVAGAKVTATVLGQERGPKTISFKYRPKARSRITKGHRQELHLIKVTEVAVNGTSAKALYEAGAADRAKAQAAAAAVAADKAKADAAVAATLKVGAPAEAKAAKKPAAKKPATAKPAAKSADTSADDAK
ncbi:MAG: 50S ribosomal protein L21 [Candidatus Aquidulcis sp.]|nr:MAG: 50S ribosomal protein L21 [Candidatus Aquidulcis sp.]